MDKHTLALQIARYTGIAPIWHDRDTPNASAGFTDGQRRTCVLDLGDDSAGVTWLCADGAGHLCVFATNDDADYDAVLSHIVTYLNTGRIGDIPRNY